MKETKTQAKQEQLVVEKELSEVLDEIFREEAKKTKEKKGYPAEALFIACRVCTEPIDGELVDYVVPWFVLAIKDQKTGELKKDLAKIEMEWLQKEINGNLGFWPVIVRFEELRKLITQKFVEELRQAKAEGKIIFSFADAMSDKLRELLREDPFEYELPSFEGEI
jgi:nitroreductase